MLDYRVSQKESRMCEEMHIMELSDTKTARMARVLRPWLPLYPTKSKSSVSVVLRGEMSQSAVGDSWLLRGEERPRIVKSVSAFAIYIVRIGAAAVCSRLNFVQI